MDFVKPLILWWQNMPGKNFDKFYFYFVVFVAFSVDYSRLIRVSFWCLME